MNPDPIAPAWVVFPIAAIVLIAVAGHIMALRELPKGKMNESRRRIRIATGWVMMFAIPLTAYGFGVANTANPELFVLVWTTIVLLLGSVLVLALVDMLNSARIHRQDHQQLRTEFRKELADEEGDDD